METSAAPSATFIICVEGGKFEMMGLRLVRSLKQFGGRWASCPVFAVSPRRHVGLARSTRDELKAMGVEYINAPRASQYPWFGFFNKPAAFSLLEPQLTTDQVVFLDSDMLVVRPPELLDLSDGFEFCACPSESSGATAGPDDPDHPYWRRITAMFGLDIDTFPRVQSIRDGKDIHIYWNAGTFSFRRSTGFIPTYHETCQRVLTSGFHSPVGKLFYVDQTVLPLMVQRLKLRFRHLPLGHNLSVHLPAAKYGKYGISGLGPHVKLEELAILHYHRSITESFDELVQLLTRAQPQAGQWLGEQGPLPKESSIAKRAAGRLLHKLRQRKFDHFFATTSTEK
jgi:hypothetical protein